MWHCTFHGGPVNGYETDVGEEPAPTVTMEDTRVMEGIVTCYIFLYRRTALTPTTATYYLHDAQAAWHPPQDAHPN